MKKYFAVLALLVASAATPMAAATLNLVAGTIDLQILQNANDFSITAFDVRNVAGFQLLEGSIDSIVLIGDGTNFALAAPAAPNTQLFVSNTDGSQAFGIAFTNIRGDGGTGLLLDAAFSFPISPVSDPALLYISNNTLTFSFVPNNIGANGGNVDTLGESNEELLSYWSISSGTGPTAVETVVPEPGSMALIGCGVALIAFARRRR